MSSFRVLLLTSGSPKSRANAYSSLRDSVSDHSTPSTTPRFGSAMDLSYHDEVKLYRGTQYEKVKGKQKVTSWTPSLPVAVIYSARPGDVWARRETEFLETSTVHSATVKKGAKILRLCRGSYCTFEHVMEMLQYDKPDGLTHEEGVKLLRILHRRWLDGMTMSGGPFKYAVYEDDDLEYRMDEDDVPLSFLDPETLISYHVIEEWEYGPEETGRRFLIDAFAVADVAVFRNVCRRLGYEGVTYQDVFVGGTNAAPELLGCDVDKLEGVREEWDIDDEEVPVHETFRPLNKEVLVDRESTPTEELLPKVACEPERVANVGALKARLLR